jgi:hypothetical protein
VQYIGNWALGKKEGQGTMYYMDNSKYEGQWKADVPHGKGTLTLSTGDIYAGAFKNGKPAGTGQYTHVTSSVIHHGKFAMGIRDGKCTITRLVSEQEKAEALKYPPMDKLVGNVVDGRVTCTNAAYRSVFSCSLDRLHPQLTTNQTIVCVQRRSHGGGNHAATNAQPGHVLRTTLYQAPHASVLVPA